MLIIDKKNKLDSGFTIIEMMISIALFTIVVTAGLTALLNANALHAKSQNMRSILDNVNFIMDDMSRSMRTGSNFRCYTTAFPVPPDTLTIGTPRSCALGGAIAFTDALGDPNPIVYKIEGPSHALTISKSTDGGNNFTTLNTPDITFENWSGFSVLGAESAAVTTDKQQPLIVIRLVGSINYQGVVTPFSLQSTVSERALDR